MVTEEEWKRIKRRARECFGIGAADLEALEAEVGRDLVFLAFDGEVAALVGKMQRNQAKQERHEANRAAWLHERAVKNGKKGAAARWAGSRSAFEQSIFEPDTKQG